MPTFTVVSDLGSPVTVRPSPTDSVQSVIGAAWAQLRPRGPAPEAYMLFHGNKQLSPSLTIRLANLPQNARLELRRTTVKASAKQPAGGLMVKVALQIVGSGRLIDEFAPSASLWDILTAAETRSKGSLNLTARYFCAGKPPQGLPATAKDLLARISAGLQTETEFIYQQPVLLLLSKEFADNDTMRATSLRSLGFTRGNVMLRLSFRDMPKSIADLQLAAADASPAIPATLTQAAGESPEMNTDAVSPASHAKQGPMHGYAQTTGTGATADAAQRSPSPSPPPAAASAGDSQLHRWQVRAFGPPAPGALPLSSRIVLPESFYEPGADEAKLVIGAQRARQADSERGFKSRKTQETEQQQRQHAFLDRHPRTTIRFRFPDMAQVQATFMSTERIEDLYAFVGRVLADPSVLQTLVLQPPVQDLAEWKQNTLVAARLTPAAVVHVRLAGTARETLALLAPGVRALAEPLEAAVADTPTDNGRPSAGASLQTPQSAGRSLIRPDSSSGTPAQSPAAGASGTAPQDGGSEEPKRRDSPRMPKWFTAGMRRSA
ncbi:hypothetical protein GGF46_004285 [Coemansia sp. RSA 552]|nr:hypothetical protein GGF46_004285 [Coemansia sp. RSA 552]